MKVTLKNWGIVPAKEMISHAGLVCYEPEMPEVGRIINTEGRLFNVGHLTTHRHLSFTFNIEGVSVAGVTFGLHLNHAFYNTGQRSGRFSKDMFNNPDMDALAAYMDECWSLDSEIKHEISKYLSYAFQIYSKHFAYATSVANGLLQEERPCATKEYVALNAEKIAQEQMRMVIPIIFSTALVHTINLSALAAMYYTAWSPEVYELTSLMVKCVLEKWPELGYMFKKRKYLEGKTPNGLLCGMPPNIGRVIYEPVFSLLHMDDVPKEKQCRIVPGDLHPLNILFFSPEFMEYNVNEVKAEVTMSLATFGQKQRHLTVRRGPVRFTGDFYVPPILRAMRLEQCGREVLNLWLSFRDRVPPSLFVNLAPYGAIIRYTEVSSFNAAICELSKRLCLCAQEEVYELARQEQCQTKGSALSGFLKPSCMMTGKCGEGVRYCGRDLKKLSEDPFPKRQV